MMMVFGLFVFELRTLPYQQLRCHVTGGTLRMTGWAGAQNGSTLAPARTS
ncbi:phage tail protein [Klebsiella pneumoniae]|nr:phage tail protein [Klebsiella pneumoniae]